MSIVAFAMPGVMELVIIGGIIVLLFGASALPKIARNAGQVLPSFKKGMAEVEKEAAEIGSEINDIKNIGRDIENTVNKAVGTKKGK